MYRIIYIYYRITTIAFPIGLFVTKHFKSANMIARNLTFPAPKKKTKLLTKDEAVLLALQQYDSYDATNTVHEEINKYDMADIVLTAYYESYNSCRENSNLLR